MTAAQVTFHPFPGITRTVQWQDVDHVSGYTTTRVYSFGWYRSTWLTLVFFLRPHAVATYGGQQQVRMGISLTSIPFSADELIQRMAQCIAEP